MIDGPGDGDGQEEDLPAPSPSPRVDLEAALLAAGPEARADGPGGRSGSGPGIVMVVSPDPDTRWYLRECLGLRPELRVIEAASGPIAEVLVVHLRPDLVILDRLEIPRISGLPVIRLIDERPLPDSPPGERTGWLTRPFNAGSLVALVDGMLDAT